MPTILCDTIIFYNTLNVITRDSKYQAFLPTKRSKGICWLSPFTTMTNDLSIQLQFWNIPFENPNEYEQTKLIVQQIEFHGCILTSSTKNYKEIAQVCFSNINKNNQNLI